MILTILEISHAVIAETCLPDGPVRLQAEGESSFDELHGTLQRHLRRRRDQGMHMIGHDDEFMQKILPFIAIVSEGMDEKTGHRFRAGKLAGDEQ